MNAKETMPSAALGQLESVWERSDQIFGILAPEAILTRPIPLRQPFLFYIGHLPAFAWNHLWRRAAARASVNAEFDTLFERGIDPPDDGEAPSNEAWPALEEVLA